MYKLKNFGFNANLSYGSVLTLYMCVLKTLCPIYLMLHLEFHKEVILFDIFIDDLPSVIKYSNCLLFADDLKLLRKIRDPYDSQLLQHDIDSIFDFCCKNLLVLNIKQVRTNIGLADTLITSSFIYLIYIGGTGPCDSIKIIFGNLVYS